MRAEQLCAQRRTRHPSAAPSAVSATNAAAPPGASAGGGGGGRGRRPSPAWVAPAVGRRARSAEGPA